MEPISLRGVHVTVEPLSHEHCSHLEDAVRDGELHKFWYTSIPEPGSVSTEIDRRLSLLEQGSMLPFAVIDNKSSRPIGMTTYMNIDHANKRVEIGSTWYRKSVQRTPLNTECKLLLLQHAFEALDCIAVEFRTHFVNFQSRKAIERVGAKLDGILRSHSISSNGTLRDTAVYSIIAAEWPMVKANLQWQLDKPR
ncbi:MAG: GNAT family N-acetyltransferase [Granulosicoccus sp.]|nr:GNAT family N-acetyltransferase [Granulosicoccus sp.]